MLTGLIVAVFYCLARCTTSVADRSLLYGIASGVRRNRRPRPGDRPLLVLPVVTIRDHLRPACGHAADGDRHVSGAWNQSRGVLDADSLVEVELRLLYCLATFSLWYAPIYGWLLLVSAWAKRARSSGVLPPLAVCLLEKIAFDRPIRLDADYRSTESTSLRFAGHRCGSAATSIRLNS